MAKQNSMDVIQVRYGVDSFALPDEDGSFKEREAFKKGMAQAKTCSLRAFIYPEKYPDEGPKHLTETEKKIQEALRFLYEQNEKDPPLFKKFPDWRQALVINCTGSKGSCGAAFDPEENTIEFTKNSSAMPWVATLAHELKHAEHCTQERYKITKYEPGQDNLGRQQVRFLDESITYPFGNYVQMLYFLQHGATSIGDAAMQLIQKTDFGTDVVLKPLMKWMMEKPKPTFWDKLLRRKPKKDYKDFERKVIPLMLDRLYHSHYKSEYDRQFPVHESDTGLDKIPEYFGLDRSYAQQLLAGKLQEVPKNNIITSVQYLLAKEEKAKVLGVILAQENKNGSGPLPQDEYDSLLDFVCTDENWDGVKALLRKRDDNGVSWVSNKGKKELWQRLLQGRPIEKMTSFILELQKGTPAVFDKTEQIDILQDDNFWRPIDKERNFRNAKVLDSDEEYRQKYEQDIEQEIKGKSKLVRALVADKKTFSEIPGDALLQAITFGYTEIVVWLLDTRGLGGALVMSRKTLHDCFDLMLDMDTAWSEQLTRGDQNCLQKRISKMLSIFLDLKDEKGQPLIDKDTLTKFTKSTSPEKTPLLCQALAQYQSEHSEDDRLALPPLQARLKKNQKGENKNNLEKAMTKLSKKTGNSKDRERRNSPQKGAPTPQQSVLLP